jgi:hypothetical protein
MAKKDTENSVAPEENAYVGVSPEYQNAANPLDLPMAPEDDDEAAIVESFNEAQAALVIDPNEVAGHLGYTPDSVHPSEATKPQDAYIDRNRAIHEGMAAGAAQASAEAAAADEPTADESGSGAGITG